MHTPEAAAKLWCPMSRVASAHKDEETGEFSMTEVNYNRVSVAKKPTMVPTSTCCLVQRCAVWRDTGDGSHGYCGLAPIPQVQN